ncbi:hypothetical protein OH76DRAFT_1312056, partial [Lentinus brumalis]
SGDRLRHLFCTILFYCRPAAPEVLWRDFRAGICDDLRRRLEMLGYTDLREEDVFDYGL